MKTAILSSFLVVVTARLTPSTSSVQNSLSLPRGGATAAQSKAITFADVQEALRIWCDGVIEIGQVYSEGGDYRSVAIEMIESTYAFNLDLGKGNQVLFKPTKAYEHPLRSNFDEAVSYFAGAGKYSEDKGFAIQPWSKIRFDIHGVFITSDCATAMGHYMFTDANTGSEVRVEYTFQYVRGPDGKLKIVLHHSSVPYNPH
mmetsp:Transcript_13916/g.18572  ORF Transcript_13916/g.18572 Transcript_13916/m.18572 type:complete len:201 (+) Transcript_13916:66-668(+)|eukprot:CAMPEP_0197290808 /NCGR_PEP_ID=MMETSP0890-20130614/10223_1 /TAXON_ID=44058 ORGANISM="Aureoumbra lagunensis, Strain CCMP1510" /NCGR_SAMPLE_ID=MMETSP0890 /ASSEMBLY_ACC=CAM_ASM_000533 /LENGTH=200 /DNA_ID=CAMNT_0042763117 /DNA_START=53 /DNA_END=655 /DNA_ORIENTATION=-